MAIVTFSRPPPKIAAEEPRGDASRAQLKGFQTLQPLEAAGALAQATIAIHESGVPITARARAVAPFGDDEARPANRGVACPLTGARYVYCQPAGGEDGLAGHGSFHLFIAARAMPANALPLIAPPRAPQPHDLVHLVAISVDAGGNPFELATLNRWVTDEWLYPAQSVVAALCQFDLSRAPGDVLLNRWLTAVVGLCAPIIAVLLAERDRLLMAQDPDGEDRAIMVASRAPVDLKALLDAALHDASGNLAARLH